MEQVKVVSHCSQPLLRCRRLLPEHMRIKMRWSHCLITEELETGPFSTWLSHQVKSSRETSAEDEVGVFLCSSCYNRIPDAE